MVAFFGILSPQPLTGRPAEEAPFKRSFFGLPADAGVVPPAERDALYLNGKQPEPDEATARRKLD